jgi:hypothetical protein
MAASPPCHAGWRSMDDDPDAIGSNGPAAAAAANVWASPLSLSHSNSPVAGGGFTAALTHHALFAAPVDNDRYCLS